MKFIIAIRIAVGKFLLKNKLKKLRRIKNLQNIDSAKSIGLVHVYQGEDEFRLLEILIAKLREKKKEVKALVFLPYPKLLEYIPQKLTIDFVLPSDLNMFYHPVSERAHSFISKRFDILIDLNLKRFFPMEYVTALSKSSFKIGVFEEDKLDVYDMMLKTKPKDDLKKVIDHVVYYLNMVNPRV